MNQKLRKRVDCLAVSMVAHIDGQELGGAAVSDVRSRSCFSTLAWSKGYLRQKLPHVLGMEVAMVLMLALHHCLNALTSLAQFRLQGIGRHLLLLADAQAQALNSGIFDQGVLLFLSQGGAAFPIVFALCGCAV